MAHFLKLLLNSKKFATEPSGGGQPNNGGQPNGGGEPSGGGDPNQPKTPPAPTEEEIQKRINEEVEKQKAEIEKKVRKEIEDNQNLTDAEKFAKEKEEFERQKQEFEKQKQEQTIALNVEKVKGIYLSGGIKEDLANQLVDKVGIDFESEKKKADEIVKLYKKALEDYKTDLLAELQKQQPTPNKREPNNGGGKNSFFDKYNKKDDNQNTARDKYFKK